jgi:hypothetical protein
MLYPTRFVAAAALAPFFLAARDASAQTHLHRLGDGAAGFVSLIAIAPIGPERAVTAVRTQSGSLDAIVWGLGADGVVTRLSTGKAGAVDRIAIAQLGRDRVVTAVRNGSQALEVIAWDIDTAVTGTIKRVGSATAGGVSEIAVAGLGRNLAVTAVRQSSGTIKLISWQVSNAGAVTRLHDITGDSGTVVSLCPMGALRVASGIRKSDGKLGVTVWDLDASGNFTRRGSAMGGAISTVDASVLSYGLFATLARTSAGTLDLRTWNVDAAGTITARSTATAGTIFAGALTSRATTQLIAAVRQSDGTLRVIDWDGVGDLARLGHIDAGKMNLVDIATLGTDRLLTAVRLSDNTLKVIAWRDEAVALLHSEWGPSLQLKVSLSSSALEAMQLRNRARQIAQPDDDVVRVSRNAENKGSATDISEAPNAPAIPGGASNLSPALDVAAKKSGIDNYDHDPMIAAGFNFLVVTQDHHVGFFDKQGVLLPSKHGEKTKMDPLEFFAGFTADTLSNGKLNENNINRHLGIAPEGGAGCDPTDALLPTPCINEFYDTRVVFDAESKRFVILSAARANTGYLKADTVAPNDPWVRRFVAIGISRTEDPRDGFHLYITAETNYSDWPRVSAQNGVVVVAHNSYQTTQKREGPTPVAYVFSLDSMGKGRPRPTNHKIFSTQTGGSVMPVVNFGSVPGRWNHLLRRTNTTVELYSFATPSDINALAKLEHSTAAVPNGSPGIGAFPMRRGTNIYFVGPKQITPRVPDTTAARYSVRVMRLPLIIAAITGVPNISADTARGFLDTYFGLRAPSDAPEDLVSYEQPAMAVTKNGDMVFVYGRTGIKTAQPLFPEARYSVYYADSRGLKRSRALMAGDFLPMTTWDGESQATTRTYYARATMDFATASSDPSNDGSVWMAHQFADSTRGEYTMVIGRVTP